MGIQADFLFRGSPRKWNRSIAWPTIKVIGVYDFNISSGFPRVNQPAHLPILTTGSQAGAWGREDKTRKFDFCLLLHDVGEWG
jgi:hypothetical protein